MNVSKDVYLKIACFADDQTILNMLSVNKKFNEPEFFRQILSCKYPKLILFRKNETWKRFYLKMIYYLDKLKRKYDFEYIPAPSFNPERLYNKLYFYSRVGGLKNLVKHDKLLFYTELNDKTPFYENNRLIYIDTPLLEQLMSRAAKSGNVKFLQFLENEVSGVRDPDIKNHIIDNERGEMTLSIMVSAVISKNDEMIKYVENKILNEKLVLYAKIRGFIESRNIKEALEYLKTVPDEDYIYIIWGIILSAAKSGNLNIVKYYLEQLRGLDSNLDNEAYLDNMLMHSIEMGHLNILKFLIETYPDAKNLLKFRLSYIPVLDQDIKDYLVSIF